MKVQSCSHSRTVSGQWVPPEFVAGEDSLPDEWNAAHEDLTYVDIDLHRYKCTQCGEVKYYSNAARMFYEDGVENRAFGLVDSNK
jgi:hypothetical protein